MRISEDNFLQQLNKKNEQALIYVMKNYGGLVKAVINRHLYGLGQYEEECIDDAKDSSELETIGDSFVISVR